MTVAEDLERQILNYFKLKMVVFFKFYLVQLRSDVIIEVLNRVSFEKFSLKGLSRMRFSKFDYSDALGAFFRFWDNLLLFELNIHFFNLFALLLFEMDVFFLFFLSSSCLYF